MISLRRSSIWMQQPRWYFTLVILSTVSILAVDHAPAADSKSASEANSEHEMKPYVDVIHGTDAKFEMVPIPGGEFVLGSPDNEAGRKSDEGPQRRVKIEPFWMGKHEVTWDEFDVWMLQVDVKARKKQKQPAIGRDIAADAVTRPSGPYVDMTMGYGHDGYPVICVTQRAAKTYCEWLSAKTGHYYRLPTEAEWEYACRAGTTTAYSFGDDASKLGDFAWYAANSEDQPHKVGQKLPNPWGLHDMHGNVMEWTLDEYLPDAYSKLPADKVALRPFRSPSKLYPHVVRGGSWDAEGDKLRSGSRMKSDRAWKDQDPNDPRSPWYQIDATFVGFRIVRPLVEDSPQQKAHYRGTGDLIPDRWGPIRSGNK